MCKFPNIPYDPNFALLSNQDIPRGTYTYLKNNGIANDLSLDGIASMEQLENHINGLITAYAGDDDALYKIFRLIQIWGGNYGKRVFIENPDFENRWNSVIRDKYRELVNVCTAIKVNANSVLGITGDDVDKTFNAICDILNAREGKKKVVPGFGVAFITKHTRFWLQQNNFNNPLPIFDSVMSWGLFKRENAVISRLKCYWKCMIEKTASLKNGMTLLALERQLFNYFPRSDERKKNGGIYKENATIHLPMKNHNDNLVESKCVSLDGEPFLLFVAERPNEYYFCQLCYMFEDDVTKLNGFDINALSDVRIILERFKKYPWYPRNPKARKTFKYVKFSGGDAKTHAISLYNDILSFVDKL